MYFEIYTFDFMHLAMILLVTIISFYWVIKIKNIKLKIWYFLSALFVLIYSGLGGAIKETNELYIFFYSIYVLVFGLTLKYLHKKKCGGQSNFIIDSSDVIILFIEKNAKLIIISYYLTLLFPLVYPVFRLGLLFHPPSPTLENFFSDAFVDMKGRDFISSIVYFISQILIPFFYLSLYKFKGKPLFLILLLYVPLYLALCDRSIVGRAGLIIPLLIIFLTYFEAFSKGKKTRIIIIAACVLPLLSYIFVQFSMVRIGQDIISISFFDSIQLLFNQEIAYPLHFDSYFNRVGSVSIMDYLEWLILLPLPGFMKFGYGDPQINLRFTELVSGLTASDIGFSINLPGLVGESIFVFGNYLFPLHAILLAVIISLLSHYLYKYNCFIYLFYYFAIYFTYNLSRGGTSSAFSLAFKQFVFFIIVIYYIRSKHKSPNVGSFQSA